MPRPRHEKLAILERRQRVAARYLRGQTQWEIARAFEVAQTTISSDLRALQAEWLAQAVSDRGERIAQEVAKIEETERAAWQAWEKSKENAETLKAKMSAGASSTEKVSKGQAGDPRFLDVILRCIARRCELLCLHAGQVLPARDKDGEPFDPVVIYVPDDGRNPAAS